MLKIKVSNQYKLKFWFLLFLTALLVLFFSVSNPVNSNSKSIIKSLATATSRTYNETIANNSLMLALSAYCDKSSVEDWDCPYCEVAKNFEIYEYVIAGVADSLVAIVGFDNAYNQIVVSFRGSYNIPNWVTNLETWQVDYPGVSGGRVHAGFYQAWKDLEEGVTTAYKEVLADHPRSPLLVTGHSLGGALASFCFLSLKDVNSDDNSTYPSAFYMHSFGQPRWGNSVMAEYFTNSIRYHWRIVNMHDIVPQVPPPLLGFEHTPSEVWYWCDRPLQYYLCDSSDGEDKKCSYVAGNVIDHLVYLNTKFVCNHFKIPDTNILPPSCFPNPNKL